MSALSDRIALARGSRFPEIDLAPQVLVNCVTGGESKGCSGGDPTAAYEWVFQNGVTDETCQNYLAKDHACDAEGICKDCKPASVFHSDKCMAREPLTKYGILEHGTVQGEENMMAEIAARGPIGCGLCVTDEFENYSGGIINDTSGCVEQDHEISIAGYGVAEDGTKYWIGRNSEYAHGRGEARRTDWENRLGHVLGRGRLVPDRAGHRQPRRRGRVRLGGAGPEELRPPGGFAGALTCGQTGDAEERVVLEARGSSMEGSSMCDPKTLLDFYTSPITGETVVQGGLFQGTPGRLPARRAVRSRPARTVAASSPPGASPRPPPGTRPGPPPVP